ncbi:MAG TPA: hypothetical protein VID30_07060 [Bradyrhizobium sp.]|jgi:hypothetical protein
MADRQSWRPILFDCPQTGHKVQGLVAEEAFRTSEPHYETVRCLACAGVHFVDPMRGKVLGAPRDTR